MLISIMIYTISVSYTHLGSVGGEITKRLVEMGQKQMSASSNYNQSK